MMNIKLPECESCSLWDNKKNKRRNKLRCMVNCNPFMNYQWDMAIAFNRATGSKQGELEYGKKGYTMN